MSELRPEATDENAPRVGWRRRGTLIFLAVVVLAVLALAIFRRPGSGAAQAQRTSPEATVITARPDASVPAPAATTPERR